MTDAKFKIIISSDIAYDDLCVEIYYENDFFAIVSQEDGFENLQIDIHPPTTQKYWSFSYSELIEILNNAKETLRSMCKDTN